jgi:hypothetical protein
MRTPKNLKKRSDGPEDVIISRKTSRSSDIGEVYFDFELGRLRYKRGINDIIDFGGGVNSEYQEVIVNISSEEILNLLDGVNLLPALSDDKYYLITSMIFECDNANYSLDESFGGLTVYMDNSGEGVVLSNSLLSNSGGKMVAIVKDFYTYADTEEVYIQDVLVNQGPLKFVANGEENPEDGTGSIRVIIKYKVRTFGE